MNKQNIFFLQQTLIIFAIVALSWIVGYWYDNYRFAFLWIFSLAFSIIVGPVLVLSYYRIIKNVPLNKLNSAFRIIIWLSIAIIVIPDLVDVILDNVYLISEPELSFISNLWLHIKWQMADFYHLNFTFLFDIFTSLLKSWPYWIVACLLYWSIRINRKLSIGA